MILKSFQAKKFKSISDSGLIEVDNQVTCLVGKNESGKTAVLESIYRLNPLSMGHKGAFDGLRDYPRRNFSRDKNNVAKIIPIEATFVIEPDEVQEIEALFGKDIIASSEIIVAKSYENKMTLKIQFNEKKIIEHVITQSGLDHSLSANVATWNDFLSKLQGISDPPQAVSNLLEKFNDKDPKLEIQAKLTEMIPKFLYFDEYSLMPGRVSITKLQNTQETQLKPDERTALSLLRLAGVEAKEFTGVTYEARKASLEAAANQLSDEVFEFWSQNKDLSVELDIDSQSPADALGQPPFLEIRIRNSRHRVTLNFGERSRGFVWFFSFLTAFSEYCESNDRMILLLDEPGLGLHAAAQGDLLRFFGERLAPEHQVLYTTHSPFMVDSTKLERVRTVEDVEHDGTKVSIDIFKTSKDTRFPLQAALGYNLAQTLFLGPDNLIVEGPADYLYLQVMSDHLRRIGRESLNPKWVILPVGGMDKIPTFIALLGTQLNVVVLLDISAGGTQRVSTLVQKGIIAGEKLIALTEFVKTAEADIEDLFDQNFYLHILSHSGVANIDPTKVKGSGRIIKRIQTAIGSSFDHYQPARYFLENQVDALKEIDNSTLDRFEALFKRINALL